LKAALKGKKKNTHEQDHGRTDPVREQDKSSPPHPTLFTGGHMLFFGDATGLWPSFSGSRGLGHIYRHR